MLAQDLPNLPNAVYQVTLGKRKRLVMPDLSDCEFKTAHTYLMLLYYIKDLLAMVWRKIVETHVKVNCRRPCGNTGVELIAKLKTLTGQFLNKVVRPWQCSDSIRIRPFIYLILHMFLLVLTPSQ